MMRAAAARFGACRAVVAVRQARPGGLSAVRPLSLMRPALPSAMPAARGVGVRFFGTEVIPVPSMGDSITEGTVVEWTVGVGDAVKVDDIVVVIETDKVSVEVRTPVGGAITEHLAEVDAVVEVGQPLFKVDTAAEGAARLRRGLARGDARQDEPHAFENC